MGVSDISRQWWSPQSGRELLRHPGGRRTGHEDLDDVRFPRSEKLLVGEASGNDDGIDTSKGSQQLAVDDESSLFEELDGIIDKATSLEADISQLQANIRDRIYSQIASGVVDDEQVNVTWSSPWFMDYSNFMSSKKRETMLGKSIETNGDSDRYSSETVYDDENVSPIHMIQTDNQNKDQAILKSRRNIDLDLHYAANMNKGNSKQVTTPKNNNNILMPRHRSRASDYIDIDHVLNNM